MQGIYSGDTTYDVSLSTAQPLVVNTPQTDSIVLTIPTTTLKLGASATFNVTVYAGTGYATAPTGTVTFKDGTTLLGTATLAPGLDIGTAGYSTSALAAGTHFITVSYGGDNSYAAVTSASQTVTVMAGTATVSLSASTLVLLPGSPITLTASVTSNSSPAPGGVVTFLDGSTALGTGTLSNGTAAFTASTLTAGTHTLSVSYAGDSSYGAAPLPSAGALSVVVRTAAATSTTLTSSALTAATGTAVTLTAAVTSTVASGALTGTVTFFDGTTSLGSGTLNAGTATFTTSSLAAGSHSIYAMYSGNTLFLTSTSATLSEVLSTPSLAISVAPSTLTIVHGQSGMATFTLTPTGGLTGNVAFSCSGLPQFASCSFNPANVLLSGAVATSVLTISTSQMASLDLPARPGSFRNSRLPLETLAFGLPFSLLALGKLRSRRSFRGLCLMILTVCGVALAFTGCGGSSFETTPPGTYTITVNATDSAGMQSQNLSVIIQ